MKRRFILSFAFATALPVLAQTAEPTLHTTADLRQREAKLTAAAQKDPTGFAVETLDDYGNDRTLLVVRLRTGNAERHRSWADQIVVKKGNITLVYGGTMLQERPNSGPKVSGETLGSGIQGGKEILLRPGDILHIPAGIPHWVKIAPGTTTTYLIFKEQ